jgi:hypothetical protein
LKEPLPTATPQKRRFLSLSFIAKSSAILGALGLIAIAGAAFLFGDRTESWTEDALLHDGRTIEVKREVELAMFQGDLSQSLTRFPSAYWLKFKHPETGRTIKWQGEPHFEPMLVDVVNGSPYLVVLGEPNLSNMQKYGCPDIPYIFLRYDENTRNWIPIQRDQIPIELKEANIAISYDGTYMPQNHNYLSSAYREAINNSSAMSGYFQRKIPFDFESWNYHSKQLYKNSRSPNDCRPPLNPHPDVLLPKPVDIELEVVESKDYFVKSADEYYRSLGEKTGAITRANCSKLIKPIDLNSSMLEERFVNDPTGSKRLPYSEPSPVPSGRMLEERTKRYCDEKFVWFVAGHEEIGRTIIMKYTSAGDVIYSVRMNDPIVSYDQTARSMVPDSLIAENGFFYFYWVQELRRSKDRPTEYPNRMAKFRFREPVQEAASK